MLKNKFYLIFLILFPLTYTCKSNKNIVERDNSVDNLKVFMQSLSNNERQYILQEGLNTNHIDNFFTEEEKQYGVTILVTDFIQSYYKNIKLVKFNKPVYFQTHKEIYNELNEKFIDIFNGYKSNDTIVINYGLRSKFYAMEVKFIKKNNKWIKVTKDLNSKKQSPKIVNFTKNKETCLAYSILKKKYPEKYSYIRLCNEFNFNEL